MNTVPKQENLSTNKAMRKRLPVVFNNITFWAQARFHLVTSSLLINSGKMISKVGLGGDHTGLAMF